MGEPRGLDPLPEPPGKQPWEQETMEAIAWHIDQLRIALSGGRFRPAVRLARHIDLLIHLAAVREEREIDLYPSSPILYRPDL